MKASTMKDDFLPQWPYSSVEAEQHDHVGGFIDGENAISGRLWMTLSEEEKCSGTFESVRVIEKRQRFQAARKLERISKKKRKSRKKKKNRRPHTMGVTKSMETLPPSKEVREILEFHSKPSTAAGSRPSTKQSLRHAPLLHENVDGVEAARQRVSEYLQRKRKKPESIKNLEVLKAARSKMQFRGTNPFFNTKMAPLKAAKPTTQHEYDFRLAGTPVNDGSGQYYCLACGSPSVIFSAGRKFAKCTHCLHLNDKMRIDAKLRAKKSESTLIGSTENCKNKLPELSRYQYRAKLRCIDEINECIAHIGRATKKSGTTKKLIWKKLEWAEMRYANAMRITR